MTLTHRYRPAGSAKDLFGCKLPEILLSGPAGTGKSRGCLEKLHALMLKYPGSRGLILRKTATSLTSTALVTFREHVAAEALESGEVKFFHGSASEASSYRYGNGSIIVVAGLDKASRIMSSEYDVCYIQEATELSMDDWEMVTTRLRHGVIPYQQLIADCNPGPPNHWLKSRCDNNQTHIIYCKHEDNPVLWDGENWTSSGKRYLEVLEGLSGVRYERLRWGKWAAADGLVYDQYDPRVHLHKQVKEPPKDWTRFWSIDFGFTNPSVCQFWCQDNDGRLYLYREIYHTGMIHQDFADKIQALRKDPDTRHTDPLPSAVICDHDADGRAVLEEKLGISTIQAHKSVLEGIDAVKERLRVQPDGKPRLFICRDARRDRDPSLEDGKKPTCTQEEMLEYVWANPVSRLGGMKEMPVKSGDHGMDAMRYLVAHVDLVGSPRIRTMTW